MNSKKKLNEFVRLKSKMYSLIAVDGKEVKKAKGVNKNVVKSTRPKEFFDALFNKKIMNYYTKRIQGKLHKIGTYSVCNISLSCFDDKRYILVDGINSLLIFTKT